MRVKCVNASKADVFVSEGQLYEVREHETHTSLYHVKTKIGWVPMSVGRFKIVSRDTNKEDKEMCKKNEDYSFHVASEYQIDCTKILETLSLSKPIALLKSEKRPDEVFIVIASQIYEKVSHCSLPPGGTERSILSFLQQHDEQWVKPADLRDLVFIVRYIAKAPWNNGVLKSRIDVTHVYA
jgi:hypothetical protein